MSTFIIVDTSNLFYRMKHVTTGDAEMKAGMALHLCFNSLRMIWKKFKADHVVFCCEGGSWRREIYPEYKAHRRVKDALKSKSEKEEDALFQDTLNMFIEFLENKTNVTVLKQSYVEGDDFVARWIDLHPEDKHIIFSSDSDFYQLLKDNVVIYDGIKGWLISNKEILDENDKPATKKTNITETKVVRGVEKKIKKTVDIAVEAPDPEYELFKKIIRGDSSDNILSAYPGVREKGSSKKPGIQEAYADRKGQGFIWNEFMQSTWVDHEGNEIRVLDAYKINRQLIDLSCQPEEIKELMDATIAETLEKPSKQGVGMSFLRFCDQMDLINIAKSPTEFATILTAKYPKEQKL